MSDEKCRVRNYLPAGVPEDDETAQVLVLTILAFRFPEGMTVLDLAAELSNDGDDWVKRAIRDLSVTELIRCDGGQVFATFGFPDFHYPELPGSQ
jgi:hypothetical protein